MENLRIRVKRSVNERFSELCTRKRITKQDAIEGLLLSLLMQDDDTVQSMMMGQVEVTDDLIELVLRRLARKRGEVRITSVLPDASSGEQGDWDETGTPGGPPPKQHPPQSDRAKAPETPAGPKRGRRSKGPVSALPSARPAGQHRQPATPH